MPKDHRPRSRTSTNGRQQSGGFAPNERRQSSATAPNAQRTKSLSFEPLQNCRYIAFNKPYGVLSQFSCPAGSDKKTLAEFGLPSGVYPIGRLDYDSEGLLLLSDDKRLNYTLLEPSHSHERIYLAQVENVPDAKQLKHLMQGVIIEGKRTLPAKAELLSFPPNLPERQVPIRFRASIPTAWIKLTLHEGRNRQVRRMTAAVGCPTLRLIRLAIGGLDLISLKLAPGKWHELSHAQVLSCLIV